MVSSLGLAESTCRFQRGLSSISKSHNGHS